MTSNYGTDPRYDLRQTYDIADLRGSIPKSTTTPGTLMSILEYNPDFSKYTYLVKLAGLEGILNSCQARYTLFVPSDTYIESQLANGVFENMDRYTARTLLLYSIVPREISYKLIGSDPSWYIDTRIRSEQLLFETLRGKTTINGCVNIVQPDVCTSNGTIHVVDKLLIPPELQFHLEATI